MSHGAVPASVFDPGLIGLNIIIFYFYVFKYEILMLDRITRPNNLFRTVVF